MQDDHILVEGLPNHQLEMGRTVWPNLNGQRLPAIVTGLFRTTDMANGVLMLKVLGKDKTEVIWGPYDPDERVQAGCMTTGEPNPHDREALECLLKGYKDSNPPKAVRRSPAQTTSAYAQLGANY